MINWPRLLTVCAILAALLVVPMVILKNRAKARDAAAAAERAQLIPPPPSNVAAQAAANNPERFGLTFGWMPDPSGDRIHASCHGEPRGMGQPHRGSCNP